jgi:VWFA-related protein
MIKHAIRTIAVAMLAALLVAGGAAPAFAQDNSGYVITISQVDTSQFPKVTAYVSVTDAQGNPVTNVPKEDFKLTENGQQVKIDEVFQAGEQGPVSTVLTIDQSGSMNTSGKLEGAKTAAHAFVNLMRPEDKTALVLFNTEVNVAQPLTADKNALNSAIDAITAINDTAMYDALDTSIAQLSGVQGRKVILILSDGLDNRSQQTADTILGGLEQAETSVYAIGLGDPAIGTSSMAGINEESLRNIAERSHGSYTFAPDPSQLEAMYQQISTRLQNEYRLTYTTPSALRDGVYRGLAVQIASAAPVQANYNPGGLIPETAQALEWPIFAALIVGLVALLALPDLIRGAGGAMKGGPFKKKSRVRITSGSSQTSTNPKASAMSAAEAMGKKGPTAPSRVRVHTKRP